jgi:hypothetical protein
MLPALRRGSRSCPIPKRCCPPFDELCAEQPVFDASARTKLAAKLLEAVEQGRCSLDDLTEIGKEGLHQTPTMWR